MGPYPTGVTVCLLDEALTMRSLAQELGVGPMELYHYCASKDDILDGIVDLLFSQMDLPEVSGDWRAEIRRRACSVRQVLRQHTWAIALLKSRSTPGPATLRHHEAVLATLRTAGLSLEMTGHAYAMLDAFVFGFVVGFVLQEAALPFGPETAPEAVAAIAAHLTPEEYPYLAEYATQRAMQPGYDFGGEFEFGLVVILDALERSLASAAEVSCADSCGSGVVDQSKAAEEPGRGTGSPATERAGTRRRR